MQLTRLPHVTIPTQTLTFLPHMLCIQIIPSFLLCTNLFPLILIAYWLPRTSSYNSRMQTANAHASHMVQVKLVTNNVREKIEDCEALPTLAWIMHSLREIDCFAHNNNFCNQKWRKLNVLRLHFLNVLRFHLQSKNIAWPAWIATSSFG